MLRFVDTRASSGRIHDTSINSKYVQFLKCQSGEIILPELTFINWNDGDDIIYIIHNN